MFPGLFLYPLKIGGIETDQWYEMGYVISCSIYESDRLDIDSYNQSLFLENSEVYFESW